VRVPARHDVPPRSDRRRWAPTTFDALVAVTPATSLAAAFGLAGGGYLTGREDLAACGAMAGAFGLVVERFRTRSVRVRLRRERSRHRTDLREVTRILNDVQRDLAGLRADLDGVRAERDAVRAELRTTLDHLAAARSVAQAPVADVPVADVPVADVPVADIIAGPVASEPAGPAVEAQALAEAPVTESPELDRPRPLSLLVPGQVRSPIATGGIPVLPPGPRELVRTIDLRSTPPVADDDTQPLPIMTAGLADALVYASMAQADAAQQTRVLERPLPRHAGALHTPDAHHCGDHPREESAAEGPRTLYVVRRGKHVA
jgi:hypothetical protein